MNAFTTNVCGLQLRKFYGLLRRHSAIVVAALCLCLASSDVALAAKRKEQVVEKVEKSYVIPYALVMMAIGLGLMFVCRPSRRVDELLHKEEN